MQLNKIKLDMENVKQPQLQRVHKTDLEQVGR